MYDDKTAIHDFIVSIDSNLRVKEPLIRNFQNLIPSVRMIRQGLSLRLLKKLFVCYAKRLAQLSSSSRPDTGLLVHFEPVGFSNHCCSCDASSNSIKALIYRIEAYMACSSCSTIFNIEFQLLHTKLDEHSQHLHFICSQPIADQILYLKGI